MYCGGPAKAGGVWRLRSQRSLDSNIRLELRALELKPLARTTQQGHGASAPEEPLRCETKGDPRLAADHCGNTPEEDESGTMEISK